MKVLLAKLGLDVHNRGAILVSNILREAGVEVIYIGNAMPEEIVQMSIRESADMIGISSLAGSHLNLGKDLINIVRSYNLPNTSVAIGGVFPPDDIDVLKSIGFDSVSISGSTSKEIIETIKWQEESKWQKACIR